MTPKTICALLVATAASLATGQSVAWGDQDENDALQIRHAKISLADAIAAAEAKTGGRAAKAEFEKAKEGWIYDVEVVAGSTVNDVHVNAESGAVLSVSADTIDADDGEDAPD